jgi:hypothetical protein
VDAAHAFVVPAFGRPHWLADCVASLQQQTVRSRILITTSTPNEHITRVADRAGIEVRVNPTPAGIAADWNFALAVAPAGWVTLAHQDDWYAPTYTERCLMAATASRAPLMVFSSALARTTDDAEAQHPRIKRLLCEMAFLGQPTIEAPWRKRLLLSFGDPVPCPTVMLNRALRPDFFFPSGFDAALDWAAWLELAGQPGEFVYVRERLVHLRVHPSSATHVHLASRKEEDERILRRLWPGPIAGLIGRLYAAGLRKYENRHRE